MAWGNTFPPPSWGSVQVQLLSFPPPSVSHYLSFALHRTQPLDGAMGGMGGSGSFSACLLLSSTAPFVSLVLCPSVGHLHVAVPQGHLLPWLYPQPCLHSVPTATFSNIPTTEVLRSPFPSDPAFGTQQALHHGARAGQNGDKLGAAHGSQRPWVQHCQPCPAPSHKVSLGCRRQGLSRPLLPNTRETEGPGNSVMLPCLCPTASWRGWCEQLAWKHFVQQSWWPDMESWHRVQASPALTEAEVTTCSLAVAAATHIKTWDFPPAQKFGVFLWLNFKWEIQP